MSDDDTKTAGSEDPPPGDIEAAMSRALAPVVARASAGEDKPGETVDGGAAPEPAPTGAGQDNGPVPSDDTTAEPGNVPNSAEEQASIAAVGDANAVPAAPAETGAPQRETDVIVAGPPSAATAEPASPPTEPAQTEVPGSEPGSPTIAPVEEPEQAEEDPAPPPASVMPPQQHQDVSASDHLTAVNEPSAADDPPVVAPDEHEAKADEEPPPPDFQPPQASSAKPADQAMNNLDMPPVLPAAMQQKPEEPPLDRMHGSAAGKAEPMTQVRNRIYDHLVEGEDDVIGLITYSLYKQDKRDWLVSWMAQHGTEPTADQTEAFTNAQMTAAQRERYRNAARQVLDAYASVAVDLEKPVIVREAVAGRVEAAAIKVERSGSWWRQISSAVIGGIAGVAIIVLVIVILVEAGVDVAGYLGFEADGG